MALLGSAEHWAMSLGRRWRCHPQTPTGAAHRWRARGHYFTAKAAVTINGDLFHGGKFVFVTLAALLWWALLA